MTSSVTPSWKAFATKRISFEDPVRTPPKVGWDQWSDMWDRFNPFTFDYRPEYVYVCGNEAAIASYHKKSAGDDIVEVRDIEIWKFDDGNLEVRCWWDFPETASHADTLEEYSTPGGQ